MFLSNLLTAITATITSVGDIGNITVRYGWICNIITGIIDFAGDVGLGIILFTVILKIITLAPDVWSRVSMKKNALKMEAMKEDLEKLQKQYAKNKDLYQQKMMALYKKNGYSAFSACLPTIITLVFFFIVIGAFNSYSQRSERDIFVGMKNSYDNVLVEEANKENPIITDENGVYVVNFDALLKKEGVTDCFAGSNGDYTLVKNSENLKKLIEKYPSVKDYIDENGNVNLDNSVFNSQKGHAVKKALIKIAETEYGLPESYLIEKGALKKEDTDGSISFLDAFWNVEELQPLKNKYSSLTYTYKDANGEEKEAYYFDPETGEINYGKMIDLPDFAEDKNALIAGSDDIINERVLTIVEEKYEGEVKTEARKAAKEWYESKNNKARSVIFPWVKNIWAADCSWTTAIPETYDKLNQKLGAGKDGKNFMSEADYNELTYDLADYKKTGFKNGNGWFILVVLSILSMAGSTIIMNKTQKTQMQLSSVDGSDGTAASTQKMMTWMMPVMFGVFSFIYSAAFSIYMVTNSLLSTGSTILINIIVEKSFKKKIEAAEKEKIENHKYGKMR